MNRNSARLALTAGVLALASAGADAEPFLTRNQHPLAALYGLPAPLAARLPTAGAGYASLGLQWANFALDDARGEQAYTLDGEVFETRLRAGRAVGDRFSVHAELAYRSLSGGTLDSAIESFHDMFGLPNGPRNDMPEDRLLIDYRTGDTAALSIDRDASGIADVPIALGYQLHTSDTSAVATWLSVKLPTGSSEDLNGSGALDVALSLSGEMRPSARWELFGQVNAAWLGDGEVLPDAQESFAYSAMAGVTWNPWRTLDLTVQIEANSAIFDTGFTGLDSDAVVVTFGGSYVTSGGWRFDAGLTEDIEVDESPDVVLHMAVRHGF